MSGNGKVDLVKTELKTADIYFQGAVLSRRGEVYLHQGRNLVHICGLPETAPEDSVRLRFEKKVVTRGLHIQTLAELRENRSESAEEESEAEKVGSAQISAPSCDKDTSVPIPARPYREEAEDISFQLQKLDEDLQKVQELKALWVRNGNVTSMHHLDASAMCQFLDSLQERIDSLDEKSAGIMQQKRLLLKRLREIQDAEKEEKEKEKRIEEERAEKEAEKKQKEAEKRRKEEEKKKKEGKSRIVTADLWAELDGMYEFELSYREERVGWMPHYDIMVDSLEQPLRLLLRGRIVQETGENWKQIALRLFTGTPDFMTVCPRLSPQYLFIRQQPVYTMSYGQAPGIHGGIRFGAQQPSMGETMILGAGSTMEPSPSAGAVPPQMPRPLQQNEANHHSTMTEYVLQEHWDIDSGKRGNTVDVQTMELPVSYVCTSTPKLFPAAWLTAVLKDTAAVDRIRGKVSIYLENNYAGEIFLPERSDEDVMEIPFGIDRQIYVRHKLLHESVSQSMLGKNKKTRIFEIIVRNQKPHQMSIRIFDRIPVSRDSGITVENVDAAGAEIDEATGELCWKLVLGPEEARVLRFTYAIVSPKGQQVNER